MKKPNEHALVISTCQACGLRFFALRRDTLFCDRRCYERSRRKVPRNPKMGAREIPLTREIIEIREVILRGASYHAEYYAATNVDVLCQFPLPEDTRRSTGLAPTLPYYRLEPFEFPMVPLEGLYTIQYFTRLGLSVPPQKPGRVPDVLLFFTYPLQRTAPADIRAGIKQLLTDRKPRLAPPRRESKRLGAPESSKNSALTKVGRGGPTKGQR